jgi:hypothetical protein
MSLRTDGLKSNPDRKIRHVYGAILRWPGLRWNTARFRAVSHRKRPYTAKLRLKIRLPVIIDPGNIFRDQRAKWQWWSSGQISN